MPKIKIDQAEFFYELHGQGHPLILIAGYSCDHTFWTSILNQLSASFQVLIFDNRGTGQTVDHMEELSVKIMAQDVIALAEALNLHRPHLVGHSMGGTIAQYVAAHYENQISKVVLLATSAKWRQASLMGLKSHIQMREAGFDLDDLLMTVIPWVFGENFLKNSDNVKALKEAIISNPYLQSLQDQKRQFQALAAFDGIQDLSSIHSPLLIGYGEQDILSLPGDSKFIAKHIPHALLKIFEFSGHNLIEEETKNLSETLLKFLI